MNDGGDALISPLIFLSSSIALTLTALVQVRNRNENKNKFEILKEKGEDDCGLIVDFSHCLFWDPASLVWRHWERGRNESSQHRTNI